MLNSTRTCTVSKSYDFYKWHLKGDSFIDTNLMHNFLYKLHKIKFLYMFRASSAHLQEVNDVNCTCMQPRLFSLSAGGRLVHLLGETPLSKCTRRPPAENENTRSCIHVQLTSLTSWRWADERWPSCAPGKGRQSLPLASAQDGHLQRMRIPEAAYMYN